MFGRGICEKYQSWDFGWGNFSSLDWYFSQIPLPSMIYLYIVTPYIRMLDSDWLIAVIFFTNSGLAL
jgi:hypothetical protein